MLIKNPHLYDSRKYALSQLFVPTMIKTYREDPEKGKKRIDNYLEACKNNNFDKALSSFGINIQDKDNYNQMLKNYRDYITYYLYLRKLEREQDIEK